MKGLAKVPGFALAMEDKVESGEESMYVFARVTGQSRIQVSDLSLQSSSLSG